MDTFTTAKEKYGPAMEMVEPEEAAAYFERLVDHCMRAGSKTRDEAEHSERRSLGYYAGYYSRDVRVQVEQLFDCQHPILGKASEKKWTPEEILALGIKHGGQKAMARARIEHAKKPTAWDWILDLSEL